MEQNNKMNMGGLTKALFNRKKKNIWEELQHVVCAYICVSVCVYFEVCVYAGGGSLLQLFGRLGWGKGVGYLRGGGCYWSWRWGS